MIVRTDDVVIRQHEVGKAIAVAIARRQTLEPPAKIVCPVTHHPACEWDHCRSHGLAAHALGQRAPHVGRFRVPPAAEHSKWLGPEKGPVRALVDLPRVEKKGIRELGEDRERVEGIEKIDGVDEWKRSCAEHGREPRSRLIPGQ
jgi:hypothetical protein